MTHERLRLVRLVALALVLASAAILYRRLGDDGLSVAAVQTAVTDAGALGIGVYVLSFVAALVVFVPPILFVGLAEVVWGPWLGLLIGWGTGTLAVQVVFWLGRMVGGQVPPPSSPRFQRLLARLEKHPIGAVIAIRLVFRLGPIVTATLAVSPVRASHHAIGRAIGLLPWMIVGVFFFDQVIG